MVMAVDILSMVACDAGVDIIWHVKVASRSSVGLCSSLASSLLYCTSQLQAVDEIRSLTSSISVESSAMKNIECLAG
jgi:aspartate carbamoyltransferase regulatory subunit